MNPSTIVDLRATPLNVELTEPFSIATGTQAVAQNALVEIRLADGTRGLGEAAPFPAVTGETQAKTLELAGALRSVLLGRSVRNWRALSAAVAASTAHAPAVRCALETAILDAFTRQSNLPLWAFFGGASTSVRTDMTIPTGSVEHAVNSARAIQGRGIGTIKIKVGAHADLDFDRVRAICQTVPTARLLLDGNGGYDAGRALQLLDRFRARGIAIALFEQPVPREAFADLARVTREGGVPVAADESVATVADAWRIVQERAATHLNVKLMKSGVVEALAIVQVARAAGLGLMIGGMVETLLAMTASAHFAAGLGGFDFVDLDTPMFMAERPFRGGWEQRGEELSVAHIAAGHGVER